MVQPDLSSRFIPLGTLLRWGIDELTEAGIPTARLDAELLLGAVLSLSRAQVLAREHITLRRQPRGRYAALIQRRKWGEPVAYILGRQPFYGRDFFVDRRVLIPRPETEELVDRCLDALEERVAPRAADIGTGSGAIAVTLAAEVPVLEAVATDISEGALAVAKENARRHGVDERIDFRTGSLLQPLQGLPAFDLIVANLPYVGTEETDVLEPDVKDYEPHEALFAGREGLDLFQPFLEQLKEYELLKQDGTVLLEIGYAQGRALSRLVRSSFPEARKIAIHKDLAQHDRIVELRP